MAPLWLSRVLYAVPRKKPMKFAPETGIAQMQDCGPLRTSDWDRLLTGADVWHVSPDALSPESLEHRCLGWLTPQERARRDRFRTDRLRHNYLTTRALCRWVLSRYTGVSPNQWQFVENPYGKPAIAAPVEFQRLRIPAAVNASGRMPLPHEFNSLYFNLTHTEGMVGCAVTRAGEVGLDAEDTSRPVDIEAVAGQVFSAAECECLSSLPAHCRTLRFYEYWVLKEAYLKALGTGLSTPPDQFTITWRDDGQPASLGDWQLALYHPTPRHVAATAVCRPVGAPLPVTWRSADVLA